MSEHQTPGSDCRASGRVNMGLQILVMWTQWGPSAAQQPSLLCPPGPVAARRAEISLVGCTLPEPAFPAHVLSYRGLRSPYSPGGRRPSQSRGSHPWEPGGPPE